MKMVFNHKNISNISNIITNILGCDLNIIYSKNNGLLIYNHINNNNGPLGVADDISDDGVW